MRKYLIVFALVFGLLFFGCTNQQAPAEEPAAPAEEPSEPAQEPSAPPGSDRDEHGCIPSAGYEWCESLQECIRPWETECPPSGQMVGNDTDEHGCKASAGYEWCESLGECIRPWETECPETPMVGNDSDEHGCKASAGYQWCESLQECVRPWETPCVSLINQVAEGFCGQENVDKVYVCGDTIRVVSSLEGGGTTVYDAAGQELATCPVVSPTSMSPECTQYLLGNNCVEEEIC